MVFHHIEEGVAVDGGDHTSQTSPITMVSSYHPFVLLTFCSLLHHYQLRVAVMMGARGEMGIFQCAMTTEEGLKVQPKLQETSGDLRLEADLSQTGDLPAKLFLKTVRGGSRLPSATILMRFDYIRGELFGPVSQ